MFPFSLSTKRMATMATDNPKEAISSAIKELKDLSARISELPTVVMQVADEGVTIAKEEMQKRNIPTGGELGDSIHAYMSNIDTATLEADAGHATFVEFGTGIVGAKSPHPEAGKRGVGYDRNAHGEKGWVYEKDGRYYHTKGYRSRPFWYATGTKLKSLAKRLIHKKLGIKGK